jgi:UDP-N-acetylglucosamine transferase subunit ALG13
VASSGPGRRAALRGVSFMIFATVGSQEPFDRLIRAVDEWAAARARTDVLAQIGGGAFRPKYVQFTDFMDPSEFNRVLRTASILVAHAGMGSIISALELGKPIVVMPRRAEFRETRNDHQVASAERFGAQGRIIVANDEQDLPQKLDLALTLGETARIDTQASPRLIATLRAFLKGGPCQLDPEASADESRADGTKLVSYRRSVTEPQSFGVESLTAPGDRK